MIIKAWQLRIRTCTPENAQVPDATLPGATCDMYTHGPQQQPRVELETAPGTGAPGDCGALRLHMPPHAGICRCLSESPSRGRAPACRHVPALIATAIIIIYAYPIPHARSNSGRMAVRMLMDGQQNCGGHGKLRRGAWGTVHHGQLKQLPSRPKWYSKREHAYGDMDIH